MKALALTGWIAAGVLGGLLVLLLRAEREGRHAIFARDAAGRTC